MKSVAIMTMLPMFAFCSGIGSLPQGEFADTEVSTNLPVVIDFSEMSRLAFRLSFDASPTNGVEVSIGEDADADGALSLGETACTFGYDCGRWFQRDMRADTETCVGEWSGSPARVERTFVLLKSKIDPAWNLAKVTRRGFGALGESILVEGRLPGLRILVR